jgi:ribosome-binding protein aMBF1 (putative translation factor)
VVSDTAREQYYVVAKPSPTFSGNPGLIRLGTSIRAARSVKKLSQEALADLANIDRSYIGGIERGEHNVALINLLKIAEALEIKLSQLLVNCDL